MKKYGVDIEKSSPLPPPPTLQKKNAGEGPNGVVAFTVIG